MLNRFRRGTVLALAMAVSFSIIQTIKPIKALADTGEHIIRIMKKSPADLPEKLTVDGEELERISNVEKEDNFTLEEIELDIPRNINVKYWVYPKADSSNPNRGYFYCRPTTTWNGDKDTGKTTGDDGQVYPDGYVVGYSKTFQRNSTGIRSLAQGYNEYSAEVTQTPKACADGSDFLNQDHQLFWEGIPVTLKMGGNFNDNIVFSTTKEAILGRLGLSSLSDLDPGDYSSRRAYMENRVGKEDGIHYGIYNDNVSANYIKDSDSKYHTECFDLPPKSDSSKWKMINGKWAFLAGEYGNETFNYYSPAKVLGTRYFANYKTSIPPHKDETPETAPCGRIVYNPDKCKWTNRGKISNGVGDYEIDIKATKPRVVEKGVTESHKHSKKKGDYCYCSRKFDVTYDLDRIETNGATNDTVSGGSGTIHIRQEGGGQEVRSTGYWKRPSYRPRWAHSHHDGIDMPDDPCNPQGHAGKYDIDWSDPVIQVQQKAPNSWKNNPYYQPIDVTVTDNLSGFNSSKSYIKITDISHYGHNYFTNLSEASLNEVKHWDLADGIYQIDIVVWDRAGNHSEYHDKWFKVDGIAPDINISDQGYHRAIDSLTFDTTISDNIEELDELTVSGWGTYGSSRAQVANQTEVMRPITYPNIKHEDTNYTFYYKVEDLATNQTTKSFVTSVVREYWKWAHAVYGGDFNTEVPVKILSTKDTKSLEGFKKSRTINFDTWRGMKVEVWYKFVSYHNCNFIRVIHYDDPNMPIITGNGEKLYPDGKGGFKDAPPLSNEIGLEVGMDEYVESFGKHTDPKPIKTVDNGDGTITNYYVNGDVRIIDRNGNLVSWKDKGFGTIIPETTEHEENRTIYHTSNRYRIEVTFNGSGSIIVVFDKNNRVVMRTSTSR